MADKKKNDINEDQILAFLQDAVSRIRTEEDPLELNLYRRLFRKGVPFTLRSYFAAYVLKQMNGSSFQGKGLSLGRPERGAHSARAGRQERSDKPQTKKGRQDVREPREPRERGENSRSDEQKKAKQAENRQVALPEDVSTTLFMSIGRNRRVYPRDLIGLIMQNVEIEREHIGEIRVLDNYSFIQVITEDAEKVIAGLNDMEYRGRKLVVSFSRKREEAAEAAPSMDMDAYGSDDSYENSDLGEGEASGEYTEEENGSVN